MTSPTARPRGEAVGSTRFRSRPRSSSVLSPGSVVGSGLFSNPEARKTCFDAETLGEALKEGVFSEADRVRAIDHFARPCDPCWGALESFSGSDIPDLETLWKNAEERWHAPPVELVLGQWIAVERGTGEDASWPPILRDLLGQVRPGGPFIFWWLLVETARYVSLKTLDPRPAKWRCLADVLEEDFLGSNEEHRELALLIRAYEGDDFRVAGRREVAEKCLDEAVSGAVHCRAAIRGTIHEIKSDRHRTAREPLDALFHLGWADHFLSNLEIPGRLAETRFRIGMAILLTEALEPAFRVLEEALTLIPEGTDPYLRLDCGNHLAATALRLGEPEAARGYLEQAEPFVDFGSWLMAGQMNWLWGKVHTESGEWVEAEKRFHSALFYFDEQRAPLARVQMFADLGEVYRRSGRTGEFVKTLLESASILGKIPAFQELCRETEEWFGEFIESAKALPRFDETIAVVQKLDQALGVLGRNPRRNPRVNS